MEPAGSDSSKLEGGERAQASDHAPLRALVIHEIIRKEGEAELERKPWATIWSGLAAGLSMGFSFAGQALLKSNLKDAIGSEALSSIGYCLGFVIVVLGRQQLFTESTLTAVLPVLAERKLGTLWKTIKLWNIVFAANILGTWIFAATLAYGHPLPADTTPSLHELAVTAIGDSFWHTLLRAVFAGWLIALMVWLLPSSRSARLLVIVVLSWAVAMGKFSHVIAGSAEGAYAVLTGAGDVGQYLVAFLIPTLIGNTIGGVSLVGLLNHAPVAEKVTG
jgi:formate/nitrite transporter FocA (FNT family)